METPHNGEAKGPKRQMSQHVCSISRTNLKLMLALLLVPVNAKMSSGSLGERGQDAHLSGFIWKIISTQLTNLQYWQMEKNFLVPLLGGWVEAICFDFLNYFLDWYGLWTQQKDKQGGNKGKEEEGTWSPYWQDSVKRRNGCKASNPSSPSPDEQTTSLQSANTGDPFTTNFI